MQPQQAAIDDKQNFDAHQHDVALSEDRRAMAGVQRHDAVLASQACALAVQARD